MILILDNSPKKITKKDSKKDNLNNDTLNNTEKNQLESIKTNLENLINSSQNKDKILNEINQIFKNVVKIDNDHHLINKLTEIDNKFEKISNENKELKQYVKEKTDTIDNMHQLLLKFKNELDELKKSNQPSVSFTNFSSNINSNTSSNLSSVSNFNRINEIKQKLQNNKSILRKFKTSSNRSSEETNHNPPSSSGNNLQNKKSIEDNIDIIPLDIDEDDISSLEEMNIPVVVQTNKVSNIGIPKLDFNMFKKQNIKKEFNDEFVEGYENFSPSWRIQCDDLKLKSTSALKLEK